MIFVVKNAYCHGTVPACDASFVSSCECNVTTVDCNVKGLRTLPDGDFTTQNNLFDVIIPYTVMHMKIAYSLLTHNGISVVPRGAFANVPYLLELDFTSNVITYIEPLAFIHATLLGLLFVADIYTVL